MYNCVLIYRNKYFQFKIETFELIKHNGRYYTSKANGNFKLLISCLRKIGDITRRVRRVFPFFTYVRDLNYGTTLENYKEFQSSIRMNFHIRYCIINTHQNENPFT